jgi:hypothetical protein
VYVTIPVLIREVHEDVLDPLVADPNATTIQKFTVSLPDDHIAHQAAESLTKPPPAPLRLCTVNTGSETTVMLIADTMTVGGLLRPAMVSLEVFGARGICRRKVNVCRRALTVVNTSPKPPRGVTLKLTVNIKSDGDPGNPVPGPSVLPLEAADVGECRLRPPPAEVLAAAQVFIFSGRCRDGLDFRDLDRMLAKLRNLHARGGILSSSPTRSHRSGKSSPRMLASTLPCAAPTP